MCRPPSEQSVRAVLGTVLPDVTIERIQPIPSPRLQRIYEVTISDSDGSDGGRTIHLVMSPSTRLRLLRSEHFMIPAEALAVRWIRETLLSKEAAEEEKKDPNQNPNIETSRLALKQIVPKLIHLSPGPNALGSTCSFFEASTTTTTQGTPIALVPGLLSSEERQQVDGQVGRMFRELAQLTSPTGRFGPAANCLSTSPSSSPRRHIIGGGGSSVTIAGTSTSSNINSSAMGGSTDGVDTWSGAFHLMLEGILRDGEDMAVMISYSAIRRHFKRLRHLLDLVTVPRLVVVDGADESNVLVSSSSSSPLSDLATSTSASSKTPIPTTPSTIAQATSKIQLDTKEAETEKEDERGAAAAAPPPTSKEDNSPMIFAGLRDWSTSIFGDPLIATVFSDGKTPSPSFLKEFNNNNDTTTNTTESTSSSSRIPLNEDIIEDIETSHIRTLLYQVYHASVSIVKEFYRPRGGSESSRRELEGRKKLTEALAKLELVQDHDEHEHLRDQLDLDLANKRRYAVARLSGEMSPAKRVKEVGGSSASAGED